MIFRQGLRSGNWGGGRGSCGVYVECNILLHMYYYEESPSTGHESYEKGMNVLVLSTDIA
jgi:hypothetical protein